jgi:hypothetical protein
MLMRTLDLTTKLLEVPLVAIILAKLQPVTDSVSALTKYELQDWASLVLVVTLISARLHEMYLKHLRHQRQVEADAQAQKDNV